MRTVTGLLLATLLVAGLPLAAQTAESPTRYVWAATPCDTWGCAIAAMATANGDPYVVVLPTKSNTHPWVVLKRTEAGILDGPADPVFVTEAYSTMGEASARFSAIDSEKIPMLVTTVDGGMIVLSFHETQTTSKKRAVRK